MRTTLTAHRPSVVVVTLTLLATMLVSTLGAAGASAATAGPRLAHKRAVVAKVHQVRLERDLVRLWVDAPKMVCPQDHARYVARAVAAGRRLKPVPDCARPVLGRGFVVTGNGPRAAAAKLLRKPSARKVVLAPRGRTLAVAAARRQPGVWVAAVVVAAAVPQPRTEPAPTEPDAPATPGDGGTGTGETAEEEWNRLTREGILAEIADRRTEVGSPALVEDPCLAEMTQAWADQARDTPTGEDTPAQDYFSACPTWDSQKGFTGVVLGSLSGEELASRWYTEADGAAWLNDPSSRDYGLGVSSDDLMTYVWLVVRQPATGPTPPPDAVTTPIG